MERKAGHMELGTGTSEKTDYITIITIDDAGNFQFPANYVVIFKCSYDETTS